MDIGLVMDILVVLKTVFIRFFISFIVWFVCYSMQCMLPCLHRLCKRGERYSNLNKKVKFRPNYLKNNFDYYYKDGHEFLVPFNQSCKQTIKIMAMKPKARPLSY